MKKYGYVILTPIVGILSISIIFTIINLFNIKIPDIYYLICSIIIMLVTGFNFGRIIKENGLYKGLLFGLSISLIMFLLSLLIGTKLSIYMLIYYVIVTLSVSFGSMIGVNKK